MSGGSRIAVRCALIRAQPLRTLSAFSKMRKFFLCTLRPTEEGSNGAIAGANADIGWPGSTVPAPATLPLMALAAAAARRRR